MWVALGIAVTAVVVIAAMTAVVGFAGHGRTAAAVVVAAVLGALMALAAAVVTRPLAAALRVLRDDRDPPGTAELAALDRVEELAALERLVHTLRTRTAMAEDISVSARNSADTASVGMFELLSGLVAAEEATRGQLSADLHDSVAQTLITARQILANPEGQQGAWERVRGLVEEAEEEIRGTMARTKPPELEDGDLATAVSGLRAELNARYLLDVKLGWPAEEHPLPVVTAITIYRFFQEGLLNVVKHADVDDAEASLEVRDGVVYATVHDDGPGFVPGEVQSTAGRHVGLHLLRDRIRLAGGQLVITSSADTGTTLRLELPIRATPSGVGRLSVRPHPADPLRTLGEPPR